MRFLSVCSGIEAASVAWHPLGWEAVAFSEIEPFPCAVLAHHYPDTPNWGDMTKYQEWPDEPIDLLCGGTPCQSFSVAGLRKGLDDPRGNLMLTFGAIAAKYRPRWLVWENVPGVLSSNGGRDFGTFLGMLGQLGYGFAYRVLDAQYFGVAQRRRRVFVVGCFGDWRRAAAVLFERHSLSGHPAPRRKAGKEVTDCVGTLTANGGGLNRPAGNANELDFCVTAFTSSSVGGYSEGVGTLRANGGDVGGGSENLIAQCLTTGTGQRYDPETETETILPVALPINTQIATRHKAMGEGTGFGIGNEADPAFTLTKGHSHAVAHAIGWSEELTASVDVAGTLQYGGQGGRHDGVMTPAMQVRRLTPVECERLQGFPDNYTAIPWRNKPASECPDGPRYKALGNSWAVPVVRWIGQRIEQVKDMK